jgi:hypothetical protein
MVVETWIEFWVFHGLALVDSTVVVHVEREGPIRRFSVVAFWI